MDYTKHLIKRLFIYAIFMLLLATGLSLNVRTGLGVSPIISVAYTFSVILDMNIGDATFILYSIFVVVQIILQLRQKKSRTTILMTVLQLPLSLVFTRVMNVISALVPQLNTLPSDTFFGSFAGRILTLVFAICLTGIGAAGSLNARIVPNPGEGIVQALADTFHKGTGITKNVFDGSNVAISLIFGFLFTGGIVGIGIGTVLAILGVGRVIALFNHFFLSYFKELCNDAKRAE